MEAVAESEEFAVEAMVARAAEAEPQIGEGIAME